MATDWVRRLEQEGRGLVETLDEHPEARRLFDGTVGRERYARYLVRTYHCLRWSMPLRVGAGERLKRLGRPPQLAELLLRRALEESGHEHWLLADLRHLGWPEERVKAAEPGPAVEAFTGWNFFTARAGEPTALFGTEYVQAYVSMARVGRAVEQLIEVGAVPDIHKAVTYLRHQGDTAGEHLAELSRVLRMVTGREDRMAVLLSARMTRVLYPGFFDGS
ncbi:heme oxygenase [Pyxidicoccus parkwayensis]|uniref:Heme oxygenase n=1 Tax=Pyxidicoccus parkwayensis TaxID=2813578 RepID=A0ABX7P405_9BACT|nr:heme oxygenase [Pyxidicoccus parkwaysis]QSQ25166.1 heme oxygenase [Pyxidicoccus parkwaysis]